MTTFVFYHHPCPDGTAAALAAYLKYGDEATYCPINYKDALPEIPPDADVFFLDFSLPRAQLDALAARVRSVVVLDHHKTAQADLADFPGALFDMTKSGAVLAWEYFHPNLPVPELFKYVQDRDLWRWEFGRATKYVGAYLYAGPLTIESYGLTMNEMERDSTKIFITGKILQEAQEANVELMIAKSFLTQVDIYTVPVVNTLLLQSEVCERLLELHPEAPFAAAFYQIGDIERWSLRSRGSFDVSTVGEKFKGGGHKGAAGFVRPAMNRVWDV